MKRKSKTKAKPKQIYLHDILYRGFQGGLCWGTQSTVIYDEQLGHETKKSRFLLRHPHALHISKRLTKGLKTTNKIVISLALSHLYDFATEKIEFCGDFEPREFFARVKNSFCWSCEISDDAFWAFTYKAFHARDIFLNVTLRPNQKPPASQPLSRALDRFRNVFLLYYPIHHTDILEKGDNVCKENIEMVKDQLGINKPVYDKYFPHHLTHHEGQGDGTDKLIIDVEETQRAARKEIADLAEGPENMSPSDIPDEELFFYYTACRIKQRDAFLDDTTREQSEPSGDAESQKGKGKVRKYDSFKDYREPAPAEGEDKGEWEDARPEEQPAEDDEDDIVEESGADGDIPETQRLKKLKLE